MLLIFIFSDFCSVPRVFTSRPPMSARRFSLRISFYIYKTLTSQLSRYFDFYSIQKATKSHNFISEYSPNILGEKFYYTMAWQVVIPCVDHLRLQFMKLNFKGAWGMWQPNKYTLYMDDCSLQYFQCYRPIHVSH